MRKFIIFIVLLSTIMTIGGCSNNGNQNSQSKLNSNTSVVSRVNNKGEENEIYKSKKKVLVAYFSRVGNTTFPKDIDAVTSASLLVKNKIIYGNTQYIAKLIQENTDGDLFLISTKEKYPASYNEVDKLAASEEKNKVDKSLKTHVKNMDKYQIIFIGFPIWYADMPRAVYSFFNEYDFAGKTIIPFSTSGGSDFSRAINEIKTLEPKANVVSEGLTVDHSKIKHFMTPDIQKWLVKIDVNS